MTLQELEQKIDAQIETQSLDFKADIPWDVKKLSKDILAMSNVKDGGSIIIGIKEEGTGFSKQGVCEENLKTFKIDVMKDQLLNYADPAVDINVLFLKDSDGRSFVVIKVLPFKELPIICRKSIEGEIQANTIYYRNTNRRVESAPISNSTDLRDVIELAAIKLMQKRQNFGYQISKNVRALLDEELKTIKSNSILDKIKSKCYWEILFQPLEDQKIELLKDWEVVIQKEQVKKEWYFPYIPIREDDKQGIFRNGDSYGGFSDLGARKEFWCAFKSGQFLFYSALTEDWYIEDPHFYELAEKYPSGKYVTLFTSVIHFITAAIEFLSRLSLQGFFKDGVRIKATLNNCENRQLYPDSTGRPFITPRVTHSNIIIEDEVFSFDEVSKNPLSISNTLIIKILDRFGYNPDSASVMVDQDKYLSGKI